MDKPDRFSLQWDEFEANLCSTFAGLRREEHFSDVTLVSEDGHLVQAHKVLLSATSPLLDTILKSQDHPKPLIFMRGAKIELLNSLLDFIYCGEVEIQGDQLDKFMALASELKVKGLSKDENPKNGRNNEHVVIGNKNAPLEAFENEEYKSEIKDATLDIFDVGDKSSEIKEYKSAEEMKEDVMDVSDEVVWENSENIFNCNLCEKTSSTLKGLEKHKYRCHSQKKEPVPAEPNAPVFACNLCDKISTSKGGLHKHKIRNH